jgi:hypothetical protein
MNTRKLFRSKRVLLEDGLQEAGILVGEEGRIEEILRKDQLGTLYHNVEVSRNKLSSTESVDVHCSLKCCPLFGKHKQQKGWAIQRWGKTGCLQKPATSVC